MDALLVAACHGMAGTGSAFLTLYRRTGDASVAVPLWHGLDGCANLPALSIAWREPVDKAFGIGAPI